jgi:hypothetical protein
MAKLFAGLMGSLYKGPLNPGQSATGYANPKVAHWLSALGALQTMPEDKLQPGQFIFDSLGDLDKKPASMVGELAQFKGNYADIDPVYARKTMWDDPSQIKTTTQNLYQDYLNNYYQSRISGKAGAQYVTLPQWINAVQLDPKVRQVWEGLFPENVWRSADSWWADVQARATKAGKSPQQWLFEG